MEKIYVRLAKKVDNSYPIYIGYKILEEKLFEIIKKIKPTKICIITDSNINKIYNEYFTKILDNFKPIILTFDAGEESKNLNTVNTLFNCLSDTLFDRKSLIIAFGGGVTGDICGFLASIYLRGVNYIQIPTSLLACVDSSIGGKTGINTEAGKNLMGTFYQPKCVIIDTVFLDTLPENEYINGLAEVVKTAIISDRKFFDFIKNNKQEILNKNKKVLNILIYKACKFKKDIVEKDEKESGLRQILNFGHTIGHSIEAASGFSIPHGYAIAIGMILESFISLKKGFLKNNDFEEIISVIHNFGLDFYKEDLKKIDENKFVNSIFKDKKNIMGNIKIVILKEIGKVLNKRDNYSFPIELDDIKNAYYNL